MSASTYLILLLAIVLNACSGLHSQSTWDEPQLTCLRPSITVPINQPEKLEPYLDIKKKTYIYTFGLGGVPTGPSVTTVTGSLLDYTDGNVCVYDWSGKAKLVVGIVPVDYAVKAIAVVQEVGEALGKAILVLNGLGFPVESVVLIGHSLGAEVMGQAGDYVSNNLDGDRKVYLLWALDNAGFLYDHSIVASPLTANSAEHLYVLHTDPDGYGSRRAAPATVDITANYNRSYVMQPGCTVKANPFSVDEKYRCSHDRAWRLFSISLQPAYSTAFVAQSAVGGDAWARGEGNPDNVVYIGLHIVTGAKGQYFLRTGNMPPYALGLQGSKPAPSN